MAATINANVQSGKVTVGAGDIAPGTRAVFGGSAIQITSTDLFTEGGSDLKRRAVELTLKNTSAEAIGSTGKIRVTMPSVVSTSDYLYDFRVGNTVETRMGVGTPGNNDGPVSIAQINEPVGVAFGPANTLFTATTGDNRTRVLRQGLVSTVSGGITDAYDVLRFVATDGREQLLVSDPGAHCLRLVTVVSGSVTVAAGSAGSAGNANGVAATARFNTPRGLCLEKGSGPLSGAILVADSGNNLIRRCEYTVNSSGLQITNVGNRITTVTNPYDVAQNEQGDIGVTEPVANRVKVYVGGGSNAPIFGGVSGDVVGLGAAIRFSSPTGITSVGNAFYIADTGNYQVKALLQKPGSQGLLADNWMAARIAGATIGDVDGAGDNKNFYIPRLIASSDTGRLAVSDAGSHKVKEVTVNNQLKFVDNPSGVLGANPSWSNPVGHDAFGVPYIEVDGPLAPGASVSLGKFAFLVPEETTSFRFEVKVSAASETSSPPDGTISDPARGSQKAIVTTIAGGRLLGYTDGTGAGATFSRPNAIELDKNGNAFVIDGSFRVRVMTTGGKVTTIIGTALINGNTNGPGNIARLEQPYGLWVNADGTELFLTETGSGQHRVRRAVRAPGSAIDDPTSWTVSLVAGSTSGGTDGFGSSATFNAPMGIDVMENGTIYVADYGNHRIRTIGKLNGSPASPDDYLVETLTGSSAGFADGSYGASQFNSPLDVAAMPGNRIAVADQGNSRIRLINLNDFTVSTLVGSGTMSPAVDSDTPTSVNISPRGLAVDKAGYLYVGDQNHIRRVAPNGSTRTIAGGGTSNLDGTGYDVFVSGGILRRGIAVRPDGNVLYGDGGRVRQIERVISAGG